MYIMFIFLFKDCKVIKLHDAGKGISERKVMTIDFYLLPQRKINLKQVINLNVGAKAMKLSGKKKNRKKLYGLAIKNFHMEVQNIFIREKKKNLIQPKCPPELNE